MSNERRSLWKWATTRHPHYAALKTQDGKRLYPRQAPWFAVSRLLSRAVRHGWFLLRYRPDHFVRSDEGFDGWLWVEAKPRFRRRR